MPRQQPEPAAETLGDLAGQNAWLLITLAMIIIVAVLDLPFWHAVLLVLVVGLVGRGVVLAAHRPVMHLLGADPSEPLPDGPAPVLNVLLAG